jgi:hypothetical protein
MEYSTHRREEKSGYRVLTGKHERKRPLTKAKRRCEDDIKICVRTIGWVVE